MTSIDVSSKTEIVMVYDGRLTVKVLNNVDFDRKLKALKQVIAVIGEEGRGTINMKGQDKIYLVQGQLIPPGAGEKNPVFFQKDREVFQLFY